MTAPTVKRGKTTLLSTDPCPRGCRTGANGDIHLLSAHSSVERVMQCTLCACVAQDVHGNPKDPR